MELLTGSNDMAKAAKNWSDFKQWLKDDCSSQSEYKTIDDQDSENFRNTGSVLLHLGCSQVKYLLKSHIIDLYTSNGGVWVGEDWEAAVTEMAHNLEELCFPGFILLYERFNSFIHKQKHFETCKCESDYQRSQMELHTQESELLGDLNRDCNVKITNSSQNLINANDEQNFNPISNNISMKEETQSRLSHVPYVYESSKSIDDGNDDDEEGDNGDNYNDHQFLSIYDKSIKEKFGADITEETPFRMEMLFEPLVSNKSQFTDQQMSISAKLEMTLKNELSSKPQGSDELEFPEQQISAQLEESLKYELLSESQVSNKPWEQVSPESHMPPKPKPSFDYRPLLDSLLEPESLISNDMSKAAKTWLEFKQWLKDDKHSDNASSVTAGVEKTSPHSKDISCCSFCNKSTSDCNCNFNSAEDFSEQFHTSMPGIQGKDSTVDVNTVNHSTTCLSKKRSKYKTKNKGVYKCHSCPAEFETAAKRHKHNYVYHKPKNHVCQTCGKAFCNPSQLKTHTMSHTKERPFVCEICSASYIWAADLTRHLKTHGQELPVKCPLCPKRCLQKSTLAIHIRRHHTKERLFVCHVCGSQFYTASALKDHTRRHTGERPYACSVPTCGCRFFTSSNLNDHMRGHAGEKRHQCSMCGSKFTRLGNLRSHLKSIHGKNDDTFGATR